MENSTRREGHPASGRLTAGGGRDYLRPMHHPQRKRIRPIITALAVLSIMLTAAAVMLLVDAGLVYLGVGLLQRETILTKWR